MTRKKLGKIQRSKRQKLIKDLAGDLSTKEMLNLFIDILPEVERKVLRLHFWEGMNFRQVAHQMNLRTATVAFVYRKGLKRIRQKKRLILSNYNGEK